MGSASSIVDSIDNKVPLSPRSEGGTSSPSHVEEAKRAANRKAIVKSLAKNLKEEFQSFTLNSAYGYDEVSFLEFCKLFYLRNGKIEPMQASSQAQSGTEKLQQTVTTRVTETNDNGIDNETLAKQQGGWRVLSGFSGALLLLIFRFLHHSVLPTGEKNFFERTAQLLKCDTNFVFSLTPYVTRFCVPVTSVSLNVRLIDAMSQHLQNWEEATDDRLRFHSAESADNHGEGKSVTSNGTVVRRGTPKVNAPLHLNKVNLLPFSNLHTLSVCSRLPNQLERYLEAGGTAQLVRIAIEGGEGILDMPHWLSKLGECSEETEGSLVVHDDQRAVGCQIGEVERKGHESDLDGAGDAKGSNRDSSSIDECGKPNGPPSSSELYPGPHNKLLTPTPLQPRLRSLILTHCPFQWAALFPIVKWFAPSLRRFECNFVPLRTYGDGQCEELRNLCHLSSLKVLIFLHCDDEGWELPHHEPLAIALRSLSALEVVDLGLGGQRIIQEVMKYKFDQIDHNFCSEETSYNSYNNSKDEKKYTNSKVEQKSNSNIDLVDEKSVGQDNSVKEAITQSIQSDHDDETMMASEPKGPDSTTQNSQNTQNDRSDGREKKKVLQPFHRLREVRSTTLAGLPPLPALDRVLVTQTLVEQIQTPAFNVRQQRVAAPRRVGTNNNNTRQQGGGGGATQQQYDTETDQGEEKSQTQSTLRNTNPSLQRAKTQWETEMSSLYGPGQQKSVRNDNSGDDEDSMSRQKLPVGNLTSLRQVELHCMSLRNLPETLDVDVVYWRIVSPFIPHSVTPAQQQIDDVWYIDRQQLPPRPLSGLRALYVHWHLAAISNARALFDCAPNLAYITFGETAEEVVVEYLTLCANHRPSTLTSISFLSMLPDASKDPPQRNMQTTNNGNNNERYVGDALSRHFSLLLQLRGLRDIIIELTRTRSHIHGDWLGMRAAQLEKEEMIKLMLFLDQHRLRSLVVCYIVDQNVETINRSVSTTVIFEPQKAFMQVLPEPRRFFNPTVIVDNEQQFQLQTPDSQPRRLVETSAPDANEGTTTAVALPPTVTLSLPM